MRSLVSRIALASALSCGVFACTADIHDNTISIPDATVNMTSTADTSNVKPNEQLPVHCDVKNVPLGEPDAQPPMMTPDAGSPPGPDAGTDSGTNMGTDAGASQSVDETDYLEIHLDTEDTPALLVTAQVTFTVTIPADIHDGDHKLICRVHKHDGTATNVVAELKITVKTT